jgi:hypothetical protein
MGALKDKAVEKKDMKKIMNTHMTHGYALYYSGS